MDGVIVINKEENITSQGVVNRVKRLFGVLEQNILTYNAVKPLFGIAVRIFVKL